MSMREVLEKLDIPVVQGGMGVGISLSGLSSAVMREGGLGVIAAALIGMGEKDIRTNFLEANTRALREEIGKAREMVRGVLGVNIMVVLSNFSDMVRTSIEEKADVIFCGASLPLDLPKYLTDGCRTKLVPIISSAKAARIICLRWLQKFGYLPDGFVVEGPMAGGHLGFSPEEINSPEFALEKLLPQVIEAVHSFEVEKKKEIPIIVAGGIYTGGDMRKFLELGAAAVQMATRFVTTHECDAAMGFKQSYVDAKKEDIGIIRSPVGLPGRALLNEFLASVARGEKHPFNCPLHCIKTCDGQKSPYCIALALINAKLGKLSKGFAFAGINAYLAEKISSVKEVFAELRTEREEATKV